MKLYGPISPAEQNHVYPSGITVLYSGCYKVIIFTLDRYSRMVGWLVGHVCSIAVGGGGGLAMGLYNTIL